MPKAAPRLLPIPLHGGLSPEEQQAMFAPPPRDTRKVVVATNIAEASVTIEGIKYVIDSGFVKVGSAMAAICLISQAFRLVAHVQSENGDGRSICYALFRRFCQPTGRTGRPNVRWEVFPSLSFIFPHQWNHAHIDASGTRSIRCISLPSPAQGSRYR